MSTAVAEVETEVVGAGPTPTELMTTANRRYRLGLDARAASIEHVIAAGEALLALRRESKRGEFERWIVDHWSARYSEALRCIRIAAYQDVVRDSGARGISDGTAAVRGLPLVEGPWVGDRSRRYTDEDRELAKSLRNEGVNYTEIAREIGCTQTTAIVWCDPGFRKRQMAKSKRRSEEFRARQDRKRDERRERSITERKDAVSKLYSMIRKGTQLADQGKSEVDDTEGKQALARAEVLLHKAEAEIVKALGLK